MSRVTAVLAVALVSFLGVTSFDVAHARAAAPPSAQASLPEGEGKAVVEKLCITCHGLDYVWPSQRTVQNWRETIDLMRSFGAEATDEQWKTITDYIIGNLAFLHVNKATAEEFGMLFGITEKAAQGVVAYRDTQGGFKTIDDFKKAPDLEAARVDALAARLIFE
jgi:competence protein ComEA